MEYHNTTFPEAVKDLAERYNVTVQDHFAASGDQNKAARRKALLKINERAAAFFEWALNHPTKGSPAKRYLKKRSLTGRIVSECRLGYAPNEWEGLAGVLRRDKVELDVAVQAGLIIPKKSGGYYDRFRGRIMFPIFDLRQQVVGFGGRVLDDSLPKYINTPETLLFQKGEFLYGLNATYKAIREQGTAVIVEGYMDWLALKVHGLDNAVATLGTALTPTHIRRLKGYAQEAVILFDSDEAGKSAAVRSLPLFLNEGLPARAVVLPEGYDPDSFVNANGVESLTALLEEAVPLFDFLIDQKVPQTGLDVEGKVQALKEVFPVLSALENDTQRSLYAQRLSERVGVKEEVLWAELKSFRNTSPGRASEDTLRGRLASSSSETGIRDSQVLDLLVHHPRTLSRLMACDCQLLLSDTSVVEIVECVFDHFRVDGEFFPERILDKLEGEGSRTRLREALHRASIFSENEVEQALLDIETRVQERKIAESLRRVRKQGEIDPMSLNQLLKLKAKRPQGP